MKIVSIMWTTLVVTVPLSVTLKKWAERGGGGGGVLQISSDGDDQRIFFGFEIFDSRIFWSRKIWQVFFCVA